MAVLLQYLSDAYNRVADDYNKLATGTDNPRQVADVNYSVPRPKNSIPGTGPNIQGTNPAPLYDIGSELGGNLMRKVPMPVYNLTKTTSVNDIAAQQASGNDVSVYTPMPALIQPLQKAEAQPYNTQQLPGTYRIVPPGNPLDRLKRFNEGGTNLDGGYQRDMSTTNKIDRGWISPIQDHAKTVLNQANVDPNPPGMAKGTVQTSSNPLSLAFHLSNPANQENMIQDRPSGSVASLGTGSGIWGQVLSTQRDGYQNVANVRQRMPWNV